MKRPNVFLSVATLLYVVAWFLPVAVGGTTLAKGGLPGWEAMTVAFSPLWDSGARDSWWQATLAVLSGTTNVWFITAHVSLDAPGRRFSMSGRTLQWGSIIAALVNTHWFFVFTPRSDLLVGYYVWLAAFVVLAVHATRRARGAAPYPAV